MLKSIFFLCAVLLQTVLAVDFPSYVTPCKHNSDMNKCLAANAIAIKPYLKKGIPQLMLPSLDPLVIQELRVNNDQLEIIVKNFNILGLSEFDLKTVDFDLSKNKAYVEVFFPHTEVDADYSIKGTFLLMQMNGAGKLNSNATKVTGKVDVTIGREIKDGKEYLKADDLKVDLKFGGTGYMYFDKLFGDREDLTVATNLALNENIIDALNEIKDLVEMGVAAFLKRFFDSFLSKFSLNDLFAE